MTRVHPAGVVAFLTQCAAVLASPLALGYATKHEALGLILVAALLQGVTRGMQHGHMMVVPTPDTDLSIPPTVDPR